MGGLSNEPIPDLHIYPQTKGSQIGDHRLSTSFGIDEQHDHHCGDDLVKQALMSRADPGWLVGYFFA